MEIFTLIFQTLLTICCAQANGMYQSDSRPERGLQGGARELASEMEIESFAAEGVREDPPEVSMAGADITPAEAVLDAGAADAALAPPEPVVSPQQSARQKAMQVTHRRAFSA